MLLGFIPPHFFNNGPAKISSLVLSYTVHSFWDLQEMFQPVMFDMVGQFSLEMLRQIKNMSYYYLVHGRCGPTEYMI